MKFHFLFFIVLFPLLVSCVGKKQDTKTDGNGQPMAQVETIADRKEQPAVQETTVTPALVKYEEEPRWLIIGGNKVINWDRPRKHEYYLESETENITGIKLWVNQKNPDGTTSLDGIERLSNLQSLSIMGWNMDLLDFSPLNSLQNLSELTFTSGDTAKLTKIPDLSDMAARESVTSIEFKDCALTSFDNIEFLPNLRYVVIAFDDTSNFVNIKALDSLEQLEELEIFSRGTDIIRLAEITALSKLSKLWLECKQVNAQGIEHLGSLKKINLFDSNVINIQYLSGLKNVQHLKMITRETDPDIRFLAGMTNLTNLEIRATEGTWGNKKRDPYQVIDLMPVGNLSQITHLELRGFILQNVAALDSLGNLKVAHMYQSILKDDSEKTNKRLVFYPEGR